MQNLCSQVLLQDAEGAQELFQELHGHLVEARELSHKQGIDGQIGVHGCFLIICHTARFAPPLLNLLVVQQLVQALLDQLLWPHQHLCQAAEGLPDKPVQPAPLWDDKTQISMGTPLDRPRCLHATLSYALEKDWEPAGGLVCAYPVSHPVQHGQGKGWCSLQGNWYPVWGSVCPATACTAWKPILAMLTMSGAEGRHHLWNADGLPKLNIDKNAPCTGPF